MIVIQKKVYGYDAQHNPIADLILSTEQPTVVPGYDKFLTFFTFEVSCDITNEFLLFFKDIKKALEICNESPHDTTLRIKVPYYDVTYDRHGVHTKAMGLVVIENNKDGTQMLITTSVRGIKFFINVEEFYNAVKLLEKLWEPSK